MYVYDKKMFNENGIYAKSKCDEENDDEKDDGRQKKVRYDEKMHEMYGTYGRTC